MKKINAEYLRNIIFGLEDGFVSTCGVLFGMATATQNKNIIVITGIITVLVEATSMGAGAYLSEKSSNQFKKNKTKSLIDGILMFISYTIAGSICVIPYILFDQIYAKVISVTLALTGIFLIGYLLNKKLKSGFEMLAIAGLAILIGYIAGELLHGLST